MRAELYPNITVLTAVVDQSVVRGHIHRNGADDTRDPAIIVARIVAYCVVVRFIEADAVETSVRIALIFSYRVIIG